jgi:TolA-binding protein
LDFPFKKLKLYVNSPDVPGYNEVDAVGLRAAGGETEWASAAQASSAYGAANQMDNVMMVDPVVPQMTDRNLRELQKEVQELRKEVEELRQLKTELKELQRRLKDAKK